MEKAIEIKNLNFTYSSRENATLREINLHIPQGEFVLLTGATGCGKSTLLKVLNGIIPHESAGLMEGQALINGLDSRACSLSQLAQQVGLVFQSPDEQIFSTVVEDEVAFGVENLALPKEKIGERIISALQAVKMTSYRLSKTNALSGGQKQRVAVASLQAMQPGILALDEPISQLDPQGAEEVLLVLQDLKERCGMTIVLVEHRIHEVAHLVDRVVIMDQGSIVLDEKASAAFAQIDVFEHYGLRVPETVTLAHALGINPPWLSCKQAVNGLKGKVEIKKREEAAACESNKQDGKEIIIKVNNVSFSYKKNEKNILQGISFQVQQGEKIALMGNNGAGKSTLLKHLMGLLKPCQGSVALWGCDKLDPYSLAGKVGMVFQNPDLMLFCETVEKEIEFGMKNLGYDKHLMEERREEALINMGLVDLRFDFPLALSRGQRFRVAIAAVLALKPKLLILDEPTTGQDKAHIEEMMKYLQKFIVQGGTLIFCTHDMETALKYAKRSIIMHDGQILADGCPKKAFSSLELLDKAGLKAPPSLQISKNLGLPLAFSVEEVLQFVCREHLIASI